jgi:formate/nitrite transporter
MSNPIPDHQMFGDAYTPSQIAERVLKMGVTKANADAPTLLILGIMAGAFIALGGLLFAVTITGSTLGFGITRFIGGITFCLGLILVVIGGAELFTGNNLLAMAWAGKMISTKAMLRNWCIVYLGNVIGALGLVACAAWAQTADMSDGSVGATLIGIAKSKAQLSIGTAFVKGILCNTLVCLAVWLAMGGHSVTDKILAIIFPISAFVAMGFEHSIANWFFIPLGMILDPSGQVPLQGALMNLLIVTLGNIVGGTLLVAGVYWVAYVRGKT